MFIEILLPFVLCITEIYFTQLRDAQSHYFVSRDTVLQMELTTKSNNYFIKKYIMIQNWWWKDVVGPGKVSATVSYALLRKCWDTHIEQCRVCKQYLLFNGTQFNYPVQRHPRQSIQLSKSWFLKRNNLTTHVRPCDKMATHRTNDETFTSVTVSIRQDVFNGMV